MKLTIVGLGPGDIDDLSRRAWRELKQAKTIYLRTSQHGCVPCLPQNDATYHSFDDLYDSAADFDTVYNTIVERLLDAAQHEDIVYAVPGDPLVGESTTTRILEHASKMGIEVEIVNGVSFIEPMLKNLGIDALNGLQLFDGLEIAAMHHPPINPAYPALIGQVYSRQVASDVKLTLMNQYPDDFQVTLMHAAGMEDAHTESVPLYEIDHSDHIGHMTSLYVPALGAMTSFEQFQEIIAHLRAPEGCPWDREQTHRSLRQYLLEETYEILEILDREDDVEGLSEELGDLLLQIVLHTQIAIDDGEFYMADVLRHVNEKMIRRHPHVFGTVDVENSDEVVANWESIKRQEKNAKGDEAESMLSSIPKGLPALLQSYQYQARVAKVGFDWHEIKDVRAKIDEEIGEVLEVLDDPVELQKEMGDLYFALVNWSRWLKVEPETALREANERFARRFHYIEQAVNGKPLSEHTLEELDAYWDEAKSKGL